ncbi:RNA chaperone Hfq [Cupriavidus metallidurans]|uniref:RNA chaperone Hfq n=1 Tax=Cupriavidus metallidurans TaxID=119219 RepID=UPI001CCE6049|nr:RNA chaperone Hfq [Cupriavidus metallidurans]UBM12739.1 RNA chaperone Hfq [Cupriavidus metallidurans]
MNEHDQNYKSMTAHGTDQYTVPRRRLTVAPRSERRDPQQGEPAQKPRERDRNGHDAVLKSLLMQKATVTVVLGNGIERTGVLFGRDAFTITLSDSKGALRLIYKHAIDEVVLPPMPGKGPTNAPNDVT